MGGDFLRDVTGVVDSEVNTAIVRAPDGYLVELLEYSQRHSHGTAPQMPVRSEARILR